MSSDRIARLRPRTQTLLFTGKVIRVKDEGMVRTTVENAMNIHRELHLADVTVERLLRRQQRLPANPRRLIYPSAAGTIMDPTNFNDQCRRVRSALG